MERKANFRQCLS